MIQNSMNLLKELSQIEDKIKFIEEVIAHSDIQIEKEVILKNMFNNYSDK